MIQPSFVGQWLSVLADVGQSIALILIVLGAVQAFLWKLAFYINLIIGIVATVVITYALSLIGLSLTWLALVFVIGIVGSVIIAFLGAILALLNGWASCAIGLFIIGLINNMGLTGSLGFAVIVGCIIVGIAAGIGAYADVFLIRSFRALGRGSRIGRRREDATGRRETVGHRYEEESRPLPVPTQSRPEQASAGVHDFCRVCNLDFLYQGSDRALKCPSCGCICHYDCLNEFVKLNGRCPNCNTSLRQM